MCVVFTALIIKTTDNSNNNNIVIHIYAVLS